MASETIPRRRVVASLRQLEASLKAERQQEVARAVEFKNQGNDVRASYHTGLADGRNSLLAEVRLLRKYSAGTRTKVETR